MYLLSSTTLQNSTPKLAWQNQENISQRSNLSWNILQDSLKIPSFWEVSLETERRCFSKVILESKVTPNISRSSDSFSTVPPIVNEGEWWCIVHHWRLETSMETHVTGSTRHWEYPHTGSTSHSHWVGLVFIYSYLTIDILKMSPIKCNGLFKCNCV